MEKTDLEYTQSVFVLVTKHAKSAAIAPKVSQFLGASLKEHDADTDMLGTFSGEIERKGSAIECARAKCELAFEVPGQQVDYALASEGSFGPDPYIPFAACDAEILYFIDRRRNFHLHVTHISNNTNYKSQIVDSWEEMVLFADSCLFPSHALICRPNRPTHGQMIFKGINTRALLEEVFRESQTNSRDKIVLVETDMRAHMNPTRMQVISETAEKLAARLAKSCPKCQTPGWGIIGANKGLECALCGLPTSLIKSNIFGCVCCSYKEEVHTHKEFADPGMCFYCNP